MANLSESPQWVDGIYQIETSDPVVGGPDGVSNQQAKELASRTSYLKKEQEKTGSALATHAVAADPHTQYAPKESPTFTGTPKVPTPATDSNSQQVATTAFVRSVSATKLAKDQNGADIPDKGIFYGNVLQRGGLSNGMKFANCDKAGDYIVTISDPRTVSDMPTYKGQLLYGYGILHVSQNGDFIGQEYINHSGDYAWRQKWNDGVYAPWVVALSSSRLPTAADVGAYTKTETDNAVSAVTTAAVNANTNANGRVPSSRTVNGKALSADIALGASDVGAFANGPNYSSPIAIADFLAAVEKYGNNSAGSVCVSDDEGNWHTYLSVKHRSGTSDGVNYGLVIEDRDMTGNHYNAIGIRKRTPAGWRGFVNLWHSENLIKQSSLTDATSGSLMVVGAFGLGAGQTSYTLGNMNDAIRNGFASYVANIPGAPTANPGYGLLFGFDANSRGQLAADAGSDELRFRATSGAVWKPWTRLINDVSVQTITGKKTFEGGLEDNVTQIGKRALSARQVLVAGNVSKLDTCVQGQTFLVESQAGGSDANYLPNTPSAHPADAYSYTCISRHDANNSIGLFLVTNLTSRKLWIMRHIVAGTRSFEWQEILLGGTNQDVTGATRFTGSLVITGQGMEIGRVGAAAPAFVDLHSSGNNIDYDARIIASGGGTANGGATLNLIAAALQWGGSTILADGKNAVADSNGYYKTPGSADLTPASIGALSVNDFAGIPQPFPGTVAPTGWLKCNGQAFNKSLYPVLASRYPSGTLPDLRGEFVRGWDDGRGVDAGREVLSAQGDAIRNITGKFNPGGLGITASGVFSVTSPGQPSNSGYYTDSAIVTFDASTTVPTANENRPRNIAFNYIVRAA